MPTSSRDVLTAANAITAVRILLFGMFWIEAASHRPKLALTLFLIAWALDAVDGLLARRLRQASEFGSRLDKFVDRCMFVVGIVVLLRYQYLPAYAVLLLVRDLGFIPALYPVRSMHTQWAGTGFLGKLATFLQGLGIVWLFFGWPAGTVLVAAVAAIGAILAFQHLRVVFAIYLLLLCTLPLPAYASDVVINELMWDGVEYVELYNGSSEAANLNGWKLTRQQLDGEEKTIIVFTDSHAIAPNGYFLLEKSEDATNITADAISSALTLVNTGELVRLYNGEQQVVDSAGGFAAWLAGKNTDTGVSMERVGDTWQSSTGSSGGRDGTPRAANSSGPPSPTATPTATATPTLAPSATAQPTYSTPVVISKFLPNPVGDDAAGEFIELYNPSNQAANVSSWQLDDAPGGSSPYTLPNNTTIPAGGYKTFLRSQTGITLNNDGETIRLIDPNGVVRTDAAYTGTAAEGAVYNRTAGSYVSSATPTPKPTASSKPTTAAKPTVAAAVVAKSVSTATPSVALSRSIIISRILANPTGDDATGEFIELKNTGATLVDLTNWQLDDEEGGSTPYRIPANTRLAAGGTLTFSRTATGIALNNNGDVVRLFGPDGTLIDSFAYDKASEGQTVDAQNPPTTVGQVAGIETEVGSALLPSTEATSVDEASASPELALATSQPQVIASKQPVPEPTEVPSEPSRQGGIATGIVLLAGGGVSAAVAFFKRQP